MDSVISKTQKIVGLLLVGVVIGGTCLGKRGKGKNLGSSSPEFKLRHYQNIDIKQFMRKN